MPEDQPKGGPWGPAADRDTVLDVVGPWGVAYGIFLLVAVAVALVAIYAF
jgi:hypothetical protein